MKVYWVGSMYEDELEIDLSGRFCIVENEARLIDIFKQEHKEWIDGIKKIHPYAKVFPEFEAPEYHEIDITKERVLTVVYAGIE